MTLRLKIGPAVIEIQADRPPCDRHSSCVPFEYSGEESTTLTIRVRTDGPLPRGNATLIGECATQWQLYEQGDGRRLEILEQVHFQPKQVALINRALDEVDFHLLPLPRSPELHQTRWLLGEVMNPFVQWWWTAWAALRTEGMILHGSATSLRGQGRAFVGPSQAGKTTIVRRCRDHAAGTVLNDDRILIWRSQQGFQVSGTPWPGELREVSPVTVPLVQLCILRKAQANRFVSLPPVQRLTRLIPEAFLPIWTREGMEGLMEIATRLAEEVPAGELQFVNDPSVAGFLQELTGVYPEATGVQMA